MTWQCVLCCLLALQVVSGLDNGLGLTPPMGWLSWERFRCDTDCQAHPDTCISEKLIMQMADLMVSEGFLAAGYEYVNIDDCWPAKERDADGKLVADPVRFPHGMKALADYVHSKGLKMGIYEDFGSATCGGYPGSEYYMQTDANTFAEWGIDFLKFDGCNSDPKDMPYAYPIMAKFLNMTGRPIMFDCEWPIHMVMANLTPNMENVRASCNLWRVHGDIQDTWDSVISIINYMSKNNKFLRAVVGPGGWNDPDMLIVGDFGLSYYQQRAQFGMWAMFAAPMLMSNDLRSISDEAKAILLNKNVIAISQDPLGDMAQQVLAPATDVTIWTKQLAKPIKGSVAIGILNLWWKGMAWEISMSLGELGLTNPKGYNLTDAWEGKPLGSFDIKQQFNVTVFPSSLQLWIAQPL